MRFIGVFLATGLAITSLTGCSTVTPEPSVTPIDYRVCIIENSDGFVDGAANEQAYQAILQSKAVLGVQATAVKAKANSTDAYYPNALQNLVKNGCRVIVGVGPELSVPIYKSALGNTLVDYVLVDSNLRSPNGKVETLSNVRTVRFDGAQSAFLAGYLAAAKSISGKVAVVGGRITPVGVDYILGFKQGVALFNETKEASVQVLGAQGSSPSRWAMVGGFADRSKAKDFAETFISQGADVIFTTAGRAAKGVGDAVLMHPSVSLIGAETDWYTNPVFQTYRGALLTSVQRNTMRVVFESVRSAYDGSWGTWLAVDGAPTNDYLGTLANQGTSLAEAHEVAYPSGALAELVQLRNQIVAGEVAVASSVSR